MGLKDDIKIYWRTGGVLAKLILINFGLFLVIEVPEVFYWLTNTNGWDIAKLFKSHSNPLQCLKKPWTPLTYMFAHGGGGGTLPFYTPFDALLHVGFNMLILYWLGRIFQDLLGNSRILGTYILGGLAGFFLFAIAYNVFPVFENQSSTATLIGASASVMAVVFGIATHQPEYEVHLLFPRISIKLKWLALIYFALDFFSIPGGNPGGHLAHIGGAIFGVVFALQLKKGNDIASGLGNWILNLGKKRAKRGKMRVEKSAQGTKNSRGSASTTEEKQAKLDHILDKVGKSGYDSLSKAEKDFLFKVSDEK